MLIGTGVCDGGHVPNCTATADWLDWEVASEHRPPAERKIIFFWSLSAALKRRSSTCGSDRDPHWKKIRFATEDTEEHRGAAAPEKKRT